MAEIYRSRAILTGTGITGGGVQEFYWQSSTATASEILATHKSWWTNIKAYIITGVTIAFDTAVDTLEDTTGEITDVRTATIAAETSTGSGSMLPASNQLVVQWRTGVYSDGRELRGRTFVPSLISTVNSGGVVLGTTVTAINGAAQNLINLDEDLCVWRRPRKFRAQVGEEGQPGYKPELSARPGTHERVIGGTCWSQFGILRSRRD